MLSIFTNRIVRISTFAVSFVILILVAFMPNVLVPTGSAYAAVGDGTAATMDNYWSGNAAWVFVKKDTKTSTGFGSYYDGSMTKVMSDGTWYFFNRKYVTDPAACSAPMDMQVRKSTDKGVTWSAPVVAITHTAGTSYSCDATDGDVYYNATENKWHFLFQCLDNTSWKGCELERAGADPMGSFTIQPTGGNPVITPGELWNPICNLSTDDCSSIAGGTGRVHDEGTFNIFQFDGTYYWVAFHGYDGVHGFRGIAKTTNFQSWIAGDPTQGVPADDVADLYDSQPWRESWATGGSIGAGAGSMIKEGNYYYHLVEASDVNLGCTTNQNWDEGLYRSTSLTSTTWAQFPFGNPIVYSSRAVEGGSILPCNVQYSELFKDPTTGFIYMSYGRRSNDPDFDGLYWYRLEKTANVLVNSDLWKADTSGWTKFGATTNMVVYRIPNNSVDGTQYLEANCGGSCSGDHSVYQDVTIPGGSSGTLQLGGKFMSVGSAGTVSLVVWQMDINHNVLKSDTFPLTTGTSWATYNKTASLLATTRILRYQFYLQTDNINFRADDMYLQQVPLPKTTLFTTGFESGQTQPTWNDTVDFSSNVTGYNGTPGDLEASDRSDAGDTTHLGSVSLGVAGTGTNNSTSYVYFKSFSVNIPIQSNTYLEYYINPHSFGASRYVAIDFHTTDGLTLRDSGAVDQNGFSMHPSSGHGGSIPLESYSLIKSRIGASLAGKTIDKIWIAYDHPSTASQFHAYIDDISIYNQ